MSARYKELETELAATIFYGEGIGERLENPELDDNERANFRSELEAVEVKANNIRREMESQKRDDERELRIASIGRDMNVRKPEEEPEVEYATAIDALFDTPEFKAIAARQSDMRGQDKWKAEVEFKVEVDPVTANPADHVPEVRPGLVQPFVYPQRIGALFTNLSMSGSSISWLDVPTADGVADYVTYGAQKPGPADVGVDIHTTKASKIATTYTVPDDALDDLTALRQTIENILMTGPGGVRVKAEIEYIQGSGTGTPLELAGIESLSPTDVSGSGSNTVADAVFAALDIEATTGFPATAVLMNPRDYFDFITIEVDGRPLFGPYGNVYAEPRGSALPPVVRSNAVPENTIYVGAFDRSILYTRQAVSVRATNEGIGLADKNLTMFVAELRQALIHPYGAAVYRKITAVS